MSKKTQKLATLNTELNNKTKEKLEQEGIDIKSFEMQPATAYFKDELSAIKNQQLNAFFVNVMQAAPASFYEDASLMDEVKKAYSLFQVAVEKRKIPTEFVDAVSGAILISKIMKNEETFKGIYAPLYATATRFYIQEKGLHEPIPEGLYENIMRVVEAHDSEAVVSPLLEARQGTAEAEVELFFNLAKSPTIIVASPAEKGENKGEGKE